MNRNMGLGMDGPGLDDEERDVKPLTPGHCETLRAALATLAEEQWTQIERGTEGARQENASAQSGRLADRPDAPA